MNRELIRQLVDDAVAWREPSGSCADCEAQDGVCDDHRGDVAQVSAYYQLLDELLTLIDEMLP